MLAKVSVCVPNCIPNQLTIFGTQYKKETFALFYQRKVTQNSNTSHLQLLLKKRKEKMEDIKGKVRPLPLLPAQNSISNKTSDHHRNRSLIRNRPRNRRSTPQTRRQSIRNRSLPLSHHILLHPINLILLLNHPLHPNLPFNNKLPLPPNRPSSKHLSRHPNRPRMHLRIRQKNRWITKYSRSSRSERLSRLLGR